MNYMKISKDILKAFIPISRFNQGEANKIFAEVKQSGHKIVMKNNMPICVLVDPQKYQEMLNIIEDNYLVQESEARVAEERVKYMVSQQEAMRELGISDRDHDLLTLDQIKTGVQIAAQEFPIKKAFLFGSYAEGTHTNHSDVDILVEFLTPAISLLTLSSLKYRLQEELKIEVDIIHGPLEQNSLISLGKVISVYEQ